MDMVNAEEGPHLEKKSTSKPWGSIWNHYFASLCQLGISVSMYHWSNPHWVSLIKNLHHIDQWLKLQVFLQPCIYIFWKYLLGYEENCGMFNAPLIEVWCLNSIGIFVTLAYIHDSKSKCTAPFHQSILDIYIPLIRTSNEKEKKVTVLS